MVTDNNYTYHYDHLIMHIIVNSLCYTSEINATLYDNYTSKIKKILERPCNINKEETLIAHYINH